MSFDEILDYVNENDEVVGHGTRSYIYQNNLYFRVINAFICNSEKKLWIPRRHPSKKLFPLHLDCSVGGHVGQGESYDNAFIRESIEEIGLNPQEYSYKKLVKLNPIEHGTSSFMWVYIIYLDGVPNFNRQDFVDHNWLSCQEILALLESGEKAKNDLPIILKNIQDKI